MAEMQKITPFLWYDTQAEEAAKLYTAIFEGSRIVNVQRYGEEGPGPKGTAMVVAFELCGQSFLALNGGPLFKFNESVSFVVHCEDQKEIDHFWEGLTADGGAPSQCGWLKDRFGLSWQIVPKALPSLVAKSPRVMQALMKMSKLDIAKLEQAARS